MGECYHKADELSLESLFQINNIVFLILKERQKAELCLESIFSNQLDV